MNKYLYLLFTAFNGIISSDKKIQLYQKSFAFCLPYQSNLHENNPNSEYQVMLIVYVFRYGIPLFPSLA